MGALKNIKDVFSAFFKQEENNIRDLDEETLQQLEKLEKENSVREKFLESLTKMDMEEVTKHNQKEIMNEKYKVKGNSNKVQKKNSKVKSEKEEEKIIE